MTTEITKQSLVARMRAMGVERVVISYSGSGDSGQVDEIAAYLAATPEVASDIDDIDAACEAEPKVILAKVRDRLLGQPTTKMGDVLEQFAYDTLESCGADDWCNNDGGQGTMTIYANSEFEGETGRIEIAHETNYTEVNHSSFEL